MPAATKVIYDDIGARGAKAEAEWTTMFTAYASKYPEEAADVSRRIAGKLPDGWEKALPTFKVTDEAVASRKLSEALLAKLSVAIPELVSGSADLTPSNLCAHFSIIIVLNAETTIPTARGGRPPLTSRPPRLGSETTLAATSAYVALSKVQQTRD